MDELPGKETLDLGAASLLAGLCLVWGFNAVAIKVSVIGIAPIFGAGIRSLIATLGLVVWMKAKRITLFPAYLVDGFVVAALFGIEFGFLYSAFIYTTASSAYILLYTSPFFNTVGAHYLLKGDRLTLSKGFGLVMAFAGVVLLLSKDLSLPSPNEFLGDMLALGAAFFWAATTIYIKGRLVGKVSPYHSLFYQTIFSIPILFLLSATFREQPIHQINGIIILSVLFQGLIVAFVSYLLWFFLVYSYPISRLSAFTFLTPIFSTVAAVVFLHEPLSLRLILSLALVSVGIYAVNRK